MAELPSRSIFPLVCALLEESWHRLVRRSVQAALGNLTYTAPRDFQGLALMKVVISHPVRVAWAPCGAPGSMFVGISRLCLRTSW